MNINWPEFEDTLHSLCIEVLGEFASDMHDQEFYAFAVCAFTTSGHYDFRICLNTEEGLHEAAVKNSELYPDANQQEIQDILRFDPVEWKYTCINVE